MKKLLTASVALATVFASLASPVLAAAPKHRAPVMNDVSLGNAHEPMLARPSDVVTAEGRVIGADPDASIRTELLRDRTQAGF